ncbi:sulfurtransferase complex subunit TusB [Marinobacter salicampi]|uniref:sulfurtransferase complex subunit TusB n=1 Tax=Marinobacter salicampi TaxID=435907 RepID=UPI00140D015C|nr:sulfurtransferase complex subunit TusB [Marinobacter salicampi]
MPLTQTGTELMPVLHVLNKSPNHPRFGYCLAALADNDALILIENAVFGLGSANRFRCRVYALQDDVKARGLPSPSAGEAIELVDLPGWVTLTATYSRIVHW